MHLRGEVTRHCLCKGAVIALLPLAFPFLIQPPPASRAFGGHRRRDSSRLFFSHLLVIPSFIPNSGAVSLSFMIFMLLTRCSFDFFLVYDRWKSFLLVKETNHESY